VTDPTGRLPMTLGDGTRKYLYGLGLTYVVSGSSIEVIHPDRLGSVRSITDGSGAVTATYKYDEWGSSGSLSRGICGRGQRGSFNWRRSAARWASKRRSESRSFRTWKP
jgi:hypothetical protein